MKFLIVTLGSLLSLGGNLIFNFWIVVPPMISLSIIAVGIATSFTPIISVLPLFTKRSWLGTAYGILVSVCAIGMAIGYAALVHLRQEQRYTELFILINCSFAVVFVTAFSMVVIDFIRGRLICKSNSAWRAIIWQPAIIARNLNSMQDITSTEEEYDTSSFSGFSKLDAADTGGTYSSDDLLVE
jgi:hypothetical protein